MLLPEVKKHYGKLKFLIDWEWVDSKSTSIEQDTNPATDEVIAEFPMATKEEAFKAVDAAQKAFQTWLNVALLDRAYMLFTMHHKFRDHFEMLCRVLTQDHGRTILIGRFCSHGRLILGLRPASPHHPGCYPAATSRLHPVYEAPPSTLLSRLLSPRMNSLMGWINNCRVLNGFC